MSDTTPLPLQVLPAWSFGGNDGSWSSFQIGVGTPLQQFNIFPSTTTSETWVPIPEGCSGILAGISDCGALRGVGDVNGSASSGFDSSASSTWNQLGIYELAAKPELYGSGDNALYGLDTVTLWNSGQLQAVTDQIVAGYATTNYWFGELGLGIFAGNFTGVQSNSTPSLLNTLKKQNLTTSRTFAYGAGASYLDDYGSLIFGGYDAARRAAVNLTVPLGGTRNYSLAVSIESIVVQNGSGSTASLTTNGSTRVVIDSSTAQMWLPQALCDNFAAQFGLTYDPETELYLVNETMHTELVKDDPLTTFKIGATSGSTQDAISITLPYAAFDLNVTIPFYNSSTRYFPIRVAANESEYVLGRAFLQEAYLFVDWERQTLTLAAAEHSNKTSKIVPVLPPTLKQRNDSSSSGISTGAIAGIVVAVVVLAIAAGAGLAFYIIRKRRAARNKVEEIYPYEKDQAVELPNDFKPGAEAMSAPLHELGEEGKVNEAAGTSYSELPGNSAEAELDGTGKVDQEKKDKRISVYELP